MTIIFDNGEFWIERLVFEASGVVTGSTSQANLNFKKEGRIRSVAIGQSTPNSALNGPWKALFRAFGSNSRFLTSDVDQYASGIRAAVRNDSGINIDVTVILTVFLSK